MEAGKGEERGFNLRRWVFPIFVALLVGVVMLAAGGTDSIYKTDYYLGERLLSNLNQSEIRAALSRGEESRQITTFFGSVRVHGYFYLLWILVLPTLTGFFLCRYSLDKSDRQNTLKWIGCLIILSLSVIVYASTRLVDEEDAKIGQLNELILSAHLKGLAEGLKSSAAKTNRKAPFAVDDMTILLKQEAVGLTLTSYLEVKIDRSKVTPQDLSAFKKETIRLRCKIAILHDGYKGGVVSIFDYVDINNEPFAKILINEEVCSR